MALISTLTRLALESGGTWNPESEHERIKALPTSVRNEVVRRLDALVPLLAVSNPGVAAADAAAALLGLSRRNVYHLLMRLKRLPPVDGVGVRGTSVAARRRSDPRGGARGDLLDDAIRDLLRTRPDARLAEFVSRARSAVEGTGQPPPAAKTVSRRLDALRAGAAAVAGPVCRRILLDESVVNVAVDRHGVPLVSSLGLLVDPDSRLILSWGLSSVRDGMPATTVAASHLSRYIAGIREKWIVADTLSSATLVLPEIAASSMPRDSEGVIDVVIAGPRIKGMRLRRVLGAGVGPLLFRPRNKLSTVGPGEEGGWHVLDVVPAAKLVIQAIRDHNAAIRATVVKSSSDAGRPKDALDDVGRIMNDARPGLLMAEDQARARIGLSPIRR